MEEKSGIEAEHQTPLQLYLNDIILREEMVTLVSLPRSLKAQVRLDEVFIPLQVHSSQPLIDYSLTEYELKVLREKLKDDTFSGNVEHLLLDTEKSWHRSLKNTKISISELWQQLTREHPVAVIQGFPGMGKSTLLARLALYMARYNLGQPDPMMPGTLKPPLIPILIRLGNYATARAKSTATLSLSEYLKPALKEMDLPLEQHGTSSLASLLQKYLDDGRCLIMFDGLDEISDEQIRWQVQEAINNFVSKWSNITERTNFNRFLITSRPASYDLMAFSKYAHYVIDEMTSTQIEEFLPRWFFAIECQDRGLSVENQYKQEQVNLVRLSKKSAETLNTAIKRHQGVRELAGNPLLLTFLAAMQLNGFDVSRQRVELYSAMTRLLLENRNIARKQEPIPEALAIERLGPLAYQMQEKGNGFASRHEVIDSLQEAIKREGGTSEAIRYEAEDFFKRISEQTGLFVRRSGDYYSFFHRTFQEFFVARHMLNTMRHDADHVITSFVEKARQRDDLWREPFLLAVTYESSRGNMIADGMIKTLLATSHNPTPEELEHDLVLAAECLIEAKPLSIKRSLEQEIASQLLETYQKAQRSLNIDACEQIEKVILRWLLSLPEEVYRSTLLTTLCEAIINTKDLVMQYTTLTLLTRIAQQLTECSSIVFDTLIPPLLALTGLPAIGMYQLNSPSVSTSADPALSDIALTILSFMGSKGPAGAFLTYTRQFFKKSPNCLRLLARYSLECNVLLSPVVVPLDEENYKQYHLAIMNWKELQRSRKTGHITNHEIDKCLIIQQSLLDCAEEVCYPTVIILLDLLESVREQREDAWQKIWQKYLLNQLIESKSIRYSEVAFLWMTLFSEPEAREKLAQMILSDYMNDNQRNQRNAQRFVAMIGNDLPHRRNLQHLRNLRYLRYMQYIGYVDDLKNLQELQGLQDLPDLPDLRYLRQTLLTPDVAKKAREKLYKAKQAERVELFTILLGRILYIQEANEVSDSVEVETWKIAQLAQRDLLETRNSETRAIAQEILSYLPVRTKNEIKFVLQLAEDSPNRLIQQLCAVALSRAQPQTSEAWTSLKSGLESKIGIVRTIVDARLKHKL